MGPHTQAFQGTLIHLVEGQSSTKQNNGLCRLLEGEARRFFHQNPPTSEDLHTAIGFYKAIEYLTRDSCDELNRGIALINIGIIHHRLFCHSHRLHHLKRAAQSCSDSFYAFYWYPLYQAVAALHLSLTCAQLEHWQDALAYLQQSKEFLEKLQSGGPAISDGQGELADRAKACLDEQWPTVSEGYSQAVQGHPSRRDLSPHMTIIPALSVEDVITRTSNSDHLLIPETKWITVDTCRCDNRGYTIEPLVSDRIEVRLPFCHVYAIPVKDDPAVCDLIAYGMKAGDYLIVNEKNTEQLGLYDLDGKMVVVVNSQRLILGRVFASSNGMELRRGDNKPTVLIERGDTDDFEIKGLVIGRLRPVPLTRDNLGDG